MHYVVSYIPAGNTRSTWWSTVEAPSAPEAASTYANKTDGGTGSQQIQRGDDGIIVVGEAIDGHAFQSGIRSYGVSLYRARAVVVKPRLEITEIVA